MGVGGVWVCVWVGVCTVKKRWHCGQLEVESLHIPNDNLTGIGNALQHPVIWVKAHDVIAFETVRMQRVG